MVEYYDDYLDEEPTRSVVRWMDRPPVQVGVAGLSTAVAGAFLLGVVAAFGVLAVTGHFSLRQVDNRTSRSIH
ncbi:MULTISPECIES: hypothetical protein [Phenylobacterium]|uniref:Uncharacterized protein n=1 Tax=Phenylobacterium koreense TaxID=266125 RepID=A0ABV2EGA9_9CAUL